MKRLIPALLMVLLAAAAVEAQTVVASTAWTAAFARLAGAETVVSIAPAEMTHPAEYEITPKDILRIREADFFVCAGYEVMMKALTDSGAVPETKVIRITTQNDWTTVETQVRAIATRLGTVPKAERNLAALKSVYDAGITLFSGPDYASKRLVVHAFQMPVIKMLGLSVAGTFGPAPLSPKEIADLSATKADIIVDNIHNPVALPLSRLLPGARYVQFLNFPGLKGTASLEDVFSFNVKALK